MRFGLIKRHSTRLHKQINMNNTAHHDDRFAKMTFASVYPLYVAKVEKKGRTKAELNEVIKWLTGYDEKALQKVIEQKRISLPNR